MSTDREREALARLISCLDVLSPAPSSTAWQIADRILAAGWMPRPEHGSQEEDANRIKQDGMIVGRVEGAVDSRGRGAAVDKLRELVAGLPKGFTPGPWKKWARRPTICVLDAAEDQSRPVVAWHGFDESSIPYAEHNANAALIALAPEMAEALTSALAALAERDALLAEAREEIGRLRTAFRVNAMRWGVPDAEINRVLDATRALPGGPA